MKKLLYVIFIVAASLSVSCLDEDYNQDDTLPFNDEAFARNVYNYVNIQNTYFSMDPALIAFRFNMLWSTGNKPRGVISDVSYNPDDSHETSNLKTDLFGTNTITETGAASGTWTIVFRESVWGDTFHDRNRAGQVIITTHNKLLEELEIGESWTISFYSGSTVYEDAGAFYRQVTTEQSTGVITPDTYLKFSEYKITRSSLAGFNFGWDITGTSYADTGSKYNELAKPKEPFTPANWTFNYQLVWMPEESSISRQTYTAVMASNYYLSGRASGKPNNMDITIDHWNVLTSVTLKPNCNPDAKYSGQEEILLNLVEFADGDPDVTDADVRVRVSFTDGGECNNNTTLIFKGKTYIQS